MFTKRTARVALIVALMVTGGAPLATAQSTVANPEFARMREKLQPGDRLTIRLVDGTSVQGTFAEAGPDSLAVGIDPKPRRVMIDLSSVSTIKRQDSVWNGILIGAGIGGAAAAVGVASSQGSDGVYGYAYIGSWLLPASGAVVGWLVDRSHSRTIYSAPSHAHRVIVMPSLMRGGQSVHLAITF